MLTRLEEAAILLAPDTPSQGDIQSARALGFTDREETHKTFQRNIPFAYLEISQRQNRVIN